MNGLGKLIIAFVASALHVPRVRFVLEAPERAAETME